MTPLRVLILRHDQIIDVHHFEDPRREYVIEFNRLNEDTNFWAVIEEHAQPTRSSMQTNCQPSRHCKSSDDELSFA